jgi:hypothetical protein
VGDEAVGGGPAMQMEGRRFEVEGAGVGVCTSDYGQLKFRKVRRPVFPLEPELGWNRPA